MPIVISLLVAVACGCGGGGDADPGGGGNFVTRQSIEGALDIDSSLDSTARALIGQVAAGQLDLAACLDGLTGQGDRLIAEISRVTGTETPSNGSLRQARSETLQYLRDRVFQLESTLGAQSPAELLALYAQRATELSAARASIEDLLEKYNK